MGIRPDYKKTDINPIKPQKQVKNGTVNIEKEIENIPDEEDITES